MTKARNKEMNLKSKMMVASRLLSQVAEMADAFVRFSDEIPDPDSLTEEEMQMLAQMVNNLDEAKTIICDIVGAEVEEKEESWGDR